MREEEKDQGTRSWLRYTHTNTDSGDAKTKEERARGRKGERTREEYQNEKEIGASDTVPFFPLPPCSPWSTDSRLRWSGGVRVQSLVGFWR